MTEMLEIGKVEIENYEKKTRNKNIKNRKTENKNQ